MVLFTVVGFTRFTYLRCHTHTSVQHCTNTDTVSVWEDIYSWIGLYCYFTLFVQRLCVPIAHTNTHTLYILRIRNLRIKWHFHEQTSSFVLILLTHSYLSCTSLKHMSVPLSHVYLTHMLHTLCTNRASVSLTRMNTVNMRHSVYSRSFIYSL